MLNENPLKYIMLNALKFSKNEKAVLAVLEKQKLARDVSKIARDAGVPRTTAVYILQKFSKWRIAKSVIIGKTTRWMYDRRLNFSNIKHSRFDSLVQPTESPQSKNIDQQQQITL